VGLQIDGDVNTVADSIRESAIRDQFVAALEDRAFVALALGDRSLVARLLTVAKLADPGSAWRDRFRDPAAWSALDQLQDLAATAFTSAPVPSEHQLALLGLLLGRAGAWGHSTQLLGEVCRRQPRNYWAQREMGLAHYKQGQFLEAVGYYRVALTLRPDNPGVLEGFGAVLYASGQREEGVAAYRRALQLAPKSTSARSRLVNALVISGYWNEAEAECRDGLEKDPIGHMPLHILAQALSQNGRTEEGIVLLRKVTEIAPHFADAHYLLGSSLALTARHEDAVTELRKARKLNPLLPLDGSLASELVALGRWEEARTVLQAAAAHEPKNPLYPCELGKLFRSRGKPEEAIRAFREAATIAPRYHAAREELEEVLLDEGRFAEARAVIEAHLAFPYHDAHRRALQRTRDHCTALLAVGARLPAVLAGAEHPTDVSTQLAVAEWCFQHQRLPATAAGFYASALAARPALANDPEAGYRVSAARAAALAGCGVGPDAPLDDRRRAELRKDAFDWLTAEYSAWAARHRSGKRGTKPSRRRPSAPGSGVKPRPCRSGWRAPSSGLMRARGARARTWRVCATIPGWPGCTRTSNGPGVHSGQKSLRWPRAIRSRSSNRPGLTPRARSGRRPPGVTPRGWTWNRRTTVSSGSNTLRCNCSRGTGRAIAGPAAP
jgi:tetratricopeptide (TPR) repeat protein